MNEKIVVKKGTLECVSEEQWNELLSKSGFKSIFQTYQWIETWWSYLSTAEEPLVLYYWSGDKLVGIMPFMRSKWKPFRVAPAIKVIKFIGAPDSDYNDCIIHEGMCDVVIRACVSWLVDHKKIWSTILLEDISENSPTTSVLLDLLQRQGWAVSCRDQATCPQTTLPSSFNDYEKGLSSNTRSVTRRKKKKLAREDNYTFETGSPEDMDDFFRLYSYRWGVMSEKYQIFHSEVVRKLEQYLSLSFIALSGERIATQYCYDFDNVRALYLSGFDTRLQHLSPGIISLVECIEDAIDKKLSVYDFMRGDEQYKIHYSDRICVNKEIVVSRSCFTLELYRIVRVLDGKAGAFFRFKLWRKFYPKNLYLKLQERSHRKNK